MLGKTIIIILTNCILNFGHTQLLIKITEFFSDLNAYRESATNIVFFYGIRQAVTPDLILTCVLAPSVIKLPRGITNKVIIIIIIPFILL